MNRPALNRLIGHRGRQPSAASRTALTTLSVSIGALAVAIPAAQAQLANIGFDHQGLALQMLEQHIRPSYARFKAKTTAMHTTIAQACKSRDNKDRDRVTKAFADALFAWSQVEHLRFGPSTDQNRYDRVVFWPDRQKIGARQVRKILAKRNPSVLTLAGLQKKSVAVQGFTALEVLLYGKKSSQLLADTDKGKFACAYAATIAANLASIADDIAADWNSAQGFPKLWLNPGPANPLYKDFLGPTAELMKSYRYGLNNLREVKLIGPMGKRRIAKGGAYRPAVPSPFELSGQCVAVIVGNANGILDFYETGGFATRLAENQPETAELITSELQSVIKIAGKFKNECGPAFHDALKAKQLYRINFPLRTVIIAGGEVLTAETGLVLGFKDDDGD